MIGEQRRLSPHAGVDALVATATAIVEELAPEPTPVGVGAAGMVSHDGHVLYSPNLPTVLDAPLREALQDATKHPIIVDNDANVAARGEIAYGAAVGVAARAVRHARDRHRRRDAARRPAVPRRARVRRGDRAHDGGARRSALRVRRVRALGGDRVGHRARPHGASSSVRAGERASSPRPATSATQWPAIHVEEAARAGDADANALLARYADNVALGLAGLANVLDPELIVIGGGLVELGPLLFDPLHAAFMRHVEGAAYRPEIPIVPAQLGERAGAVGAAVLARELLP